MKFFDPKNFEDEKDKFPEITKITEDDPTFISIKNIVHKAAKNLPKGSDKKIFIGDFYEYLNTIIREKKEQNFYGAISYTDYGNIYCCSKFNSENHIAVFLEDIFYKNKPVILWEVIDGVFSMWISSWKEGTIKHFYYGLESTDAKLRILEAAFLN